MIAWAIVDTVEDFNITPPLIGNFTFTDIAARLVVRGASIAILESVGILQTRNHLTFSDGGISVSVSDKTPLLMQWIGLLKNDYESKKKQYKTALNIERAYGTGVHSEYWTINGCYESMVDYTAEGEES
jgi:hypothetical protein